MAAEQRILLKQDGICNLCDKKGNNDVETRSIIFHPNLNVILVFESNNYVKVLDIHSGTLLQTYDLSGNVSKSKMFGRFMPSQGKVLFWDGEKLGYRGDYNGVLLLDTILQAPIQEKDDTIKLEMLLSEAILFQSCVKDLEQENLGCPTDVSNELIERIKQAQANVKKGIKAQRWNTVCLETTYATLKFVANNAVVMLKRLERHIPALAIASAINERLTDLLFGSRIPDISWNGSNFQRIFMYSEAVRRQTFDKWPHMDYKWALPDQMAQAGFYHQPSSSGEDRAMCFTCNVCLVCWEKTDEPWSEHERHSPLCPFVKGEYTQNVPLTVTLATAPAVTIPGLGFDVISNSDYAYLLCTSCTQTGETTVWSLERQLKPLCTFNVADILDATGHKFEWGRITAICVLPNDSVLEKIHNLTNAETKKITGVKRRACSGTGVTSSSMQSLPSILRTDIIGSKIVVGITARKQNGDFEVLMLVLRVVKCYPLVDTITKFSETAATSSGGGGDDSSGSDKYDRDDENKSACFAKYADSFDSNGFVNELMPMKKNENGSGDKSDTSIQFNMMPETEFLKINAFGQQMSNFTNLLDKVEQSESLLDPLDSITISTSSDFDMEPTYFKDKLLAATQVAQQNHNNNNNNNNYNDNNGSNNTNNNNNNDAKQLAACDDVEVAFESLVKVESINALSMDENEELGDHDRAIIEISDIIPTDFNCKQLLVKLQKKLPTQETTRIAENILNEKWDDRNDLNSNAIAAQLLLFEYSKSHISKEYSMAITFTNAKRPKQLYIVPQYQFSNDNAVIELDMEGLEGGTLCVVCYDGTIEIYSINDFQLVATIQEKNHHFVSIAYCRSLSRLCCSTKTGALVFYSFYDIETEVNDEMLELIEECCTADLTVTDGNHRNQTDANSKQFVNAMDILNITDMPNNSSFPMTGSFTEKLITKQLNDNPMTPNIKIDCSQVDAVINNTNTAIIGGLPVTQSSPSPSSSSCASALVANLLANKIGDFSLDDLRTFYSLTQFDDTLSAYTADVPSCWNDLVQVQKQRKQPQNTRHGDDGHLTKTWRLHNDATTWDEHVIELNLTQPVNLGHIDFKFTLYQQCHNPAAIQVTLLKQNTTGFAYRMKGSHPPYKTTAVDDNIDFTLNNADANENPVLSEEYLQSHNAEILVGPIELSQCIDLCDQGGTIVLTSPKLFKTRTRNFLLHIKTMSDPTKDGQTKTRAPPKEEQIQYKVPTKEKFEFTAKTHCGGITFLSTSAANALKYKPKKIKIHKKPGKSLTISAVVTKSVPVQTQAIKENRIGCDWLHEISISVRGVKFQNNLPNERLQRIAMLESNMLLENLFKIITSLDASILEKNLSLDILNWICFIRLNRYRSPKSERIKGQINKTNSSGQIDLLAQQFECVCIAEKYLENMLRNCIINSDRTMAHKCVKLILLLTEGACSLPVELHVNSKLVESLRNAIINTFNELPSARYSSVIRWYTMLACATSTVESHNTISELCVKHLIEISKEIDKRWDSYCALLGTRFGLYGYPFESEIFDFDLPNASKNNAALPTTLVNVIRTNAGLIQVAGMDIKKLCSIDGVDFRSFPHLIKCKSVSNQLRGLLEVEQLHFTCTSTSEATRIDNMDLISTSSTSNLNMEDLIVAPVQLNAVEIPKELDNEKFESFQQEMIEHQLKLKKKLSGTHESKANGGSDYLEAQNSAIMKAIEKMEKKKAAIVPKFKAICRYIELYDEKQQSPAAKVQQYLNDQSRQNGGNNSDEQDSSPTEENSNSNTTNVFAWHKLLSPPPKQMIIIDRMHSGARRFVVLDFGSPILLTDLVIPSCDELGSLHIDIWCFEEESDCVRLVTSTDIGAKTLVLSDIQPPPICRYLKITIIGRIGMSSTKCKIPLGSFYGQAIILENFGYGDMLMRYLKHSSNNVAAQIQSLNALNEDIMCRYNLASCKLMELLAPTLHSELSNVAHMQAFIQKQRDDETVVVDTNKISSLYEECITLQHQLNVVRNVIKRLETSLLSKSPPQIVNEQLLQLASRDKLRVLGQNMIEILLHFSIDYGIKNILPVHQLFTLDIANMLFNSLVVYGDAHLQLATCSLLVRMCCFQNWWGDFLADIFCNLYSSQNSKIFPQDRIFFLLTYMGRRSIAMGTCRSIVIDAVLKTLAKLLAPISPRYLDASNSTDTERNITGGLWSKSDLQLITWLLLFLSVCLDDGNDRKDKSANRWDFMSCESDFSKTRTQSSTPASKNMRCFKKRIIQQSKYSVQPYTDWGKKIYMIQNHPNIFMEMAGKTKSKQTSSSKANIPPKVAKESNQDTENNFDKGLKTMRLNNILIVIRGLIALLLEMDFTCNMDQFLLTCKVIARLVSACRPSVQLSKIITTSQLEQIIRLAVWNDQQQPWAVHAITCLLQDLLDADKHFKDNDATPTNDGVRHIDNIQESKEIFQEYPPSLYMPNNIGSMVNNLPNTSNDIQISDGVKYSYLPSLIECDDAEFDEILQDIDIMERSKPPAKKDNVPVNKNTFSYFCKSISSAMDARLEKGLDLNIEIQIRRLTMLSSLDMYSSLPQILANEFVTTPTECAAWPDYITDIWSGSEYNSGQNTYKMFKNVFDCIFTDLHIEDTWVHLEQVLQMWLTLNGELADKPYCAGLSQTDVPKIPFGANAVQGLLLSLAWHNDVKLRTWCLGFQCLFLACNSQSLDDDVDTTRINEVIVNDENFEKMLLRFFSGFGMSSSIITNRCAGPTICKHLHELLTWLHKKDETTDGVLSCKRKLKDTLLQVIFQLVQPGGAICNQQGPIDAQSQLVRDVLLMTNDKADLNVSLNIIESVSFLVFNNISNGDKLQCQRPSDNCSSNTFSSLFANVLGSENSKQTTVISDSSLIISLLKLSSSLVQTELPRQPSEVPIPEEEELPTASQTDETKAEQLNNDGPRAKTPCIADTVLRRFAIMKRLLGSLSYCSSRSFTLMFSQTTYPVKPAESSLLVEEPQTSADAVFNLLMILCEKSTSTRLIVSPISQYLEQSTTRAVGLPRLQLSEPFLWFIFKVLQIPTSVQIFTQMGGIQVICKNLVNLNKKLVNMQPGLISLIMQHINKSAKLKHQAQSSNGSNSKKSGTTTTQSQRSEGLINFAPFCSISSENDTAQSAEILIMNPVSTHRRPRTAAWSYMFYPNESHVDLTITLPTAIMLKEVQLHPHGPTLASCPSAVALEISSDYGVGPIPVGPPLNTTGMTCIRLKLDKAEIASSLVLRLYRPKDSSNIGLTQIAVLGTTIFANSTASITGTNTNNMNINPTTSSSSSQSFDYNNDAADTFAKTSIGWIRILSHCYDAAVAVPESKLAIDVVGASANYPGFIEACCTLMNIMPMIPTNAQQNLESVLVRLGAYNRDLCLSLLNTLLWNTTPQTYKLSNDSICDLLFELSTSKDAFLFDKLHVLLEWVIKLRQNYSSRTVRCNNPQSGFVKCVAAILWTVHEQNPAINFSELITREIFDACLHWIDILEYDEPLKKAFDSLLCSLCCIKPELFNQLLIKVDVKLQETSVETMKIDSNSDINHSAGCSSNVGGLTDDNKGLSGNEWFAIVAAKNLKTLLEYPSYLATIAMACQSPLAVYQLVDSGLPKLLAHALYEYCSYLVAEKQRNTQNINMNIDEQATTSNDINHIIEAVPASADEPTNSTCLTDSDKAADTNSPNLTITKPLLTSAQVPKILDFFSECCAEGYMRDWLGTQQGSIFWKPLLELLCNHRSFESINGEPLQPAFMRIERATINFFTRSTSCHPKNQESLTSLLISVIRNTFVDSANNFNRTTISGFTRQVVLQLLLENERILVSVRSKQPLQRMDIPLDSLRGVQLNSMPSTITMSLVNHHPSKRIGSHHLLFQCNANTKCQEILWNCTTVYNDIISSLNPESSTPVGSLPNSAPTTANCIIPNGNSVEAKHLEKVKISDNFINMPFPLNTFENDMEFVSVAAGVTAKDKRLKDAKNVATVNEKRDLFNHFSMFSPTNGGNSVKLIHTGLPELDITYDTTISQILATLHNKGHSLSTPCLSFELVPANKLPHIENEKVHIKASDLEPLPSPLQRFSSRGGLSLLAQYLPTVYPENTGHKTPTAVPEKEKSPPMADWVKLEPNYDIYEDLEDPVVEPTTRHVTISSVPQHSLAAFGLFLRLPVYSDVLLRDKIRAQCLLRLVLGVTGDGEGNDIYSLSLASSLPTLPFEVFRQLLDSSPLTTDDGMLLRRMVIDVGAMHLVLNCLSVFTHQSHNFQITSPQNETPDSGVKTSTNFLDEHSLLHSDDKSHVYWAKGTGFGTGSTAQSWNVEQALMRQKSEEEHVTVLLLVLSSYINPGDRRQDLEDLEGSDNKSAELPQAFLMLLQQSCLIPALSSYLRNDSVLDITRHIPLYRAILQLLRSLSQSQQLVSLLQPQKQQGYTSPSISLLLSNMKTCVDTYAKRLRLNKKSNIKGQTQQVIVSLDDGDDEGLALLIPDIQETTIMVQKSTSADAIANQMESDGIMQIERPPQSRTVEERYLEVMKNLQFDTSDMIVEGDNNGMRFIVPYHFEKMVQKAGDRYHPSRVKRLAQEAVTLSTSLPLSYSSSVFVRCDTDRLDIMKVLITGPADTPYANGCFEFDVFFPPDYPNLPMLINLETTGRHSVRFNPNLYNDGKVCLSVLNTWHGRPEEKWNAQTSSFLQVLVSIQSLILVPEPYFNEPGFERSRGTLSGTHSSREYNSNIYQACVRWAMLEQIRSPSPCFRDVIHTHFWLKRNEICAQIENWIEELTKPQYNERNSRSISFNSMVLRRQYRHLRDEFAKLKAPDGLEDLDIPFNANASSLAMSEAGPLPSLSASTSGVNTFPNGLTISSGLSSSSSLSKSLIQNEVIKQLNTISKKSEILYEAVNGLQYAVDGSPSMTSSDDCSTIIDENNVDCFNEINEAASLLLPPSQLPPIVALSSATENDESAVLDDVVSNDELEDEAIQVDIEDFNFNDSDVSMMEAILLNSAEHYDEKLSE